MLKHLAVPTDAPGNGESGRNSSSNNSNAGAAAAGADAANRNQSPHVSNAGAAAAGPGIANRNQSPNMSHAGAVTAGVAYANRNQYDQYHPGIAYGTWNGNYGASAGGGAGGVGPWGAGSPADGYGYSHYSNPDSGAAAGVGLAAGGAGIGQQGSQAQPASASAYNYAQPLNTAAAPPAPDAADQGAAAGAKARESFQSGDYAPALQLTQQALGQMPNDAALYEFLALVLFAQAHYEQGAAPLYAVLSVGPGWNWTTLIDNDAYADTDTRQLRSRGQGPVRTGLSRYLARARRRRDQVARKRGGAPAERHPLGPAPRQAQSDPRRLQTHSRSTPAI